MAAALAVQPCSIDITNFSRTSRIVTELCGKVMRDVLTAITPPANFVPNNFLTPRRLKTLNQSQITIINQIPANANYDDCDISLLYTLIRNTAPNTYSPTNGWGRLPINPNAVIIWDDIERLRDFRNSLLGHIKSASFTNAQFQQFVTDLTPILGRFDTTHRAFLG